MKNNLHWYNMGMKLTKYKICTCNWINPDDSISIAYLGTIYQLKDTTYILELDVPIKTLIYHAKILNGQDSLFKYTLIGVNPKYSVKAIQNNTDFKTISLTVDFIIAGITYYESIPSIKYGEIQFDGKIGEWCLNTQINNSLVCTANNVETHASTQNSEFLNLYQSESISLKIGSKIQTPQMRFDDFIIYQDYLLIVENVSAEYEDIEFLVVTAKSFISFLIRNKINFKNYEFYDDNSFNVNKLFTYQDIIDITYPTNELNGYGLYYTSQSIWNLQKAFLMWHEFCKSQPVIIDLYFHNSPKSRTADVLFKQLQCLENIHKHIFMRQKCPKLLKNLCYFKTRVSNLYDMFPNVMQLIGEKDIFCTHLRNHRNWFAHLNQKDKKNILPQNKMGLLSFDCNILIDMCFLFEMGVPISDIESRIIQLNHDMVKNRKEFGLYWS